MAGYREGEGGSFTHDGKRYDLDEAFALADKKKVRNMSVNRLKWVLKYDKPNKRRLKLADISAPILVASDKRGRPTVIDGLHRLAKANATGVSRLPARYLSKSDMAKLSQERSILMNVHDYIEKNAGLRSFLRDVSGRSLRKARKRAAASEVSLNKARDVYEDQMRSFEKTRDKIDPEDFMRAKQDYRSYVELNNDARKAIRMHNAGKSRSEIAESTKWKWLGRDPNLARGALKDSTEYIQDAKPKLKQMAFDMKEYNKARKAAQKLHSEQSIIENAHADRRYQAQMARERQDKARERVRNFFRKQF